MPPKTDTHINALAATIPFIAPERFERAFGRPFDARLGANEGNFGCSPMAAEAMSKAATDCAGNYPDPECFELRKALAGHLNIKMNNIVVGAGIDGLLGLIVRIFSSAGDTVLTSLGAYPTFNYHVAGYDRRLDLVPYKNDKEDLDGLAKRAQALRPAIIYVSNPDNPMGTCWTVKQIERFADAIPPETLLIVDEAYGETAPPGTLPKVDTNRPNVLRLRTFSKAYGLAGLRCGYAFGHTDLIAPFEKVRDHFGVNLIAQQAAIAALGDDAWLNLSLAKIRETRSQIGLIAERAGLTPIASATNFVTIDCGRDGIYAAAVLDSLIDQGIFVRKPMAPVLDRCIRVSVGRPDEISALETALIPIIESLK